MPSRASRRQHVCCLRTEGRTSHPFTTTAGLLPSLQTVAPVSVTIRRCGDYFELAGAVQRGLYPRAPLPFRTVVNGNTLYDLNRDPTMGTMTIGDIMGMFNLLIYAAPSPVAFRPPSSLDKGGTSESFLSYPASHSPTSNKQCPSHSGLEGVSSSCMPVSSY